MDRGIDDGVLAQFGPLDRGRLASRLFLLVGNGAAVVLVLVLVGAGQGLVRSSIVAAVLAVLSAVPTILLTSPTTVTVTWDGITVTGGPRRARGDRRWAELLEVCLTDEQQEHGWALGLRPKGTTWDSPGPLSPMAVVVALNHEGEHEHVRNVLQTMCARHGVAFSEEYAGLESAPPGSNLRSD